MIGGATAGHGAGGTRMGLPIMVWNAKGASLSATTRGDRRGKWVVVRNSGEATAEGIVLSLRIGANDRTDLLLGVVPAELEAGASFELAISNWMPDVGVFTLRWIDATGRSGTWHGPVSR